ADRGLELPLHFGTTCGAVTRIAILGRVLARVEVGLERGELLFELVALLLELLALALGLVVAARDLTEARVSRRALRRGAADRRDLGLEADRLLAQAVAGRLGIAQVRLQPLDRLGRRRRGELHLDLGELLLEDVALGLEDHAALFHLLE